MSGRKDKLKLNTRIMVNNDLVDDYKTTMLSHVSPLFWVCGTYMDLELHRPYCY